MGLRGSQGIGRLRPTEPKVFEPVKPEMAAAHAEAARRGRVDFELLDGTRVGGSALVVDRSRLMVEGETLTVTFVVPRGMGEVRCRAALILEDPVTPFRAVG